MLGLALTEGLGCTWEDALPVPRLQGILPGSHRLGAPGAKLLLNQPAD
jgi:hypothetical protein